MRKMFTDTGISSAERSDFTPERVSILRFRKQPLFPVEFLEHCTLIVENVSEKLYLTPDKNFLLIRSGRVVGAVAGRELLNAVRRLLRK